jgi:hypothetical protein
MNTVTYLGTFPIDDVQQHFGQRSDPVASSAMAGWAFHLKNRVKPVITIYQHMHEILKNQVKPVITIYKHMLGILKNQVKPVIIY